MAQAGLQALLAMEVEGSESSENGLFIAEMEFSVRTVRI